MASDFQYSQQLLQNPRRGRRFAISDIHGYAQTLKALVHEKIQLTPLDQLFLLGDYIDRGPDSAGVIDFILELQTSEYQVHGLRGNHEENFLESYHNYHTGVYQKYFLQILETEKLSRLVDSHKRLLPSYSFFFNSLPYYVELDRFYLVHAGFRFSNGQLLDDFGAMITLRRFTQNPTAKTIIHGHEITDLAIIEHKIQTHSSIIPLDNGCYYGPVVRMMYPGKAAQKLTQNIGKLLALNLDTYELLAQENID